MITPFADDEAAAAIGGLSIENGTARVVISGSVEITRNAAGLERARALMRLANDLVVELEAADGHGDATAGPPVAAASDTVANPFA